MADISKVSLSGTTYDIKDASARSDLLTKQDVLTSGTNIKTVNNNSILGSGNLPVVQGEYDSTNTKVELEQGTNALSFIQTTDGLSVTANAGSGSDFIDRELVSKSYVSQYQTQAQVEALILDELSRFDKLDYKIVQTLPATGTAGVRYLVKHATEDRYEEYIYINGTWYDIGATNEVNLNDYYTKTEADLLLADKADTADIPTLTSELTNDGDGTHNFVTFGDAATENTYGVVKLNPTQSVTLDSNGKLQVGGRLGQFEGTTGIYASNDREPRNVGDSSFLITDAKGVDLDTNRAFALVSGLGVTCKSAAAGATEYRVANNYNNRIVCKMAEGGYASINEATSKIEQIVQVVSVTINGSTFTPDSSANSSNDIVIKTATSLNPDSATTGIRLFGKMQSYSSAHIGNGIASWGGGRNFLLGGGVTKADTSNDVCAVGNGIYVRGNGTACFGRYHIGIKNRGFLAGTGHDSTNAPAEGAAAFGQYSSMTSTTLFAVGNGTSHTARSNAFEVTSDGGIVLKAPNGTRYKIKVSNTGALTTTAI